MKYFIRLFILSIYSSQDKVDLSKMIIIYFTRTGNTELFANYIKENIDIASYKINPVTAYPEDYNQMLEVARNEQSNNARPEIKEPLTDNCYLVYRGLALEIAEEMLGYFGEKQDAIQSAEYAMSFFETEDIIIIRVPLDRLFNIAETEVGTWDEDEWQFIFE